MICVQDKWEIPSRNTCGKLQGGGSEAPYEIRDKLLRLKEFISTDDTDHGERYKLQLPETYSRNTPKENECLEFVETFENQYTQLYPSREPLLLSPKNETSKVRKFICTFLRPTQLPYSELYDWESMVAPGREKDPREPPLLRLGCAQFIANYVKYEPLPPPGQLPEVISSPSTTLKMQIGDCFDISILLCSLLLGVGYDAYVVVGYASREVCDNDQKEKEWPHAARLRLDTALGDDDDPEVMGLRRRQKDLQENKYFSKLKPRPNLTSDFDRDEEAAKKEAARREAEGEGKGEEEKDKDADDDDTWPKKKLVHCWVMLKGSPGKRCDPPQGQDQGHDSKETGGPPPPGVLRPQEVFFIEPSTGLRVEINDANYYAIESIFNDENYWVNMQTQGSFHPPGMEDRPSQGDAEPRYDKTYFNLGRVGEGGDGKSRWEPVFLQDDSAGDADDHADAGGDARQGVEDEDADLMPPSWVQQLTLSRRQYENRYPGMAKEIEYKNATVKLFACYSQVNLRTKRVILKDRFGLSVEEHEFYEFREDKLRRRSIYPHPDASGGGVLGHRDALRVKHEWFDEGRKSKEANQPQEALAEFIVEEGRQRTMKFYSKARLDGLKRRVELFFDAADGKGTNDDRRGDGAEAPLPRKIIEYYQDRDDRLVYRSATFKPPAPHRDDPSHRARGADAGHDPRRQGPAHDAKQVPYKMTEKFARNTDIAADTDCAKRTFIPTREHAAGTIRVEFHYDLGRITRSSRHYCREGKAQPLQGGPNVLQVETVNPTNSGGAFVTAPVLQPHMKKPQQSQLAEELRALQGKEKRCQSEIDERRTQMELILKERREEDPQSTDLWRPGQEEEKEKEDAYAKLPSAGRGGRGPMNIDATGGKRVGADISVYDVLRNQTKETQHDEEQRIKEEKRRADQRKDYLAPYLSQYNKSGGDLKLVELKPKEAMEVKALVLKELKDRLIQRAHIMQNRLDKEKEDLARQQQNFHKSQEQMSEHKEHEAYIRFVEDSMWRISILEKRLERHQDQALQKYATLDTRLRNDPRLKDALAQAQA